MWIIAQDSRKTKGQTIYLKSSSEGISGWTEKLSQAYKFGEASKAHEQANKLRFNNPRVLNYYEELFRVELEKSIEELLTGGDPLVRQVVAKIVKKLEHKTNSS